MGGSGSKEDVNKQTRRIYHEFNEHPLLTAIENPINRFCDDFASSLVEDTKQSESPFGINENEEISGYTISRKIDSGAEATVYEALKNKSTTPIALKKYKNVKYVHGGRPKEVFISSLLDHPNILPIYDCFQNPNGDFILTMPLSRQGSLKSSNTSEITVIGALMLLQQMGSALSYMHSLGLVHRDIKPSNILVFDDCFKLCDFSISVKMANDQELISGVIGTTVFIAPEISNNMYAPKPTDIWALGVTVFSLLFGKYPFQLEKGLEMATETTHGNNVNRRLVTETLDFPPTPAIPDELKQILAKMLDINPETRMTAQEIAENEWIHEKLEEWDRLMNFVSNSGQTT